MRLAAVAALVAILGLTGCGSHRSVPASRPPAAKPSPETQLTGNRNVRADLPALMRALVPAGERATLSADELTVNECGISPTFPCVNAFFSVAKGRPFAVRLRRLRALAVGNGWQVVRVKREQNATYLELVHGDVHARYTLSRLGGPGDSIVEVSVVGPQTLLPTPSAAEMAAWSPEKQKYVKDANRVCAREFARLGNPKKFARVLADTSRSLAALPPPEGVQEKVETFLRPLRNAVQAAQAADRAKGEDVLPAAVAIGQYATRFDKATARYGLDKCVLR
jgi:hypothetical protein